MSIQYIQLQLTALIMIQNIPSKRMTLIKKKIIPVHSIRKLQNLMKELTYTDFENFIR